MLKFTAPLVISCVMALSTPASSGLPLKALNTVPQGLTYDSQLWGNQPGQPADKQALLAAIDDSLRYFNTNKSVRDYRNYRVKGITRDRVRRSLRRFRQLLVRSQSPEQLAAAVQKEFVLYKSVGNDQKGTVLFTGYYEATYDASRVRTSEYRYPLYKAPANLRRWSTPHPTRAQLEGADGLQADKGRLRGLELVWLKDRFEAFLVQVQGSARLNLTDGTTMSVGFDGKTKHPYTSIGKEMINDGLYTLDQMSLPTLINHFKPNPTDQNRYLPRNRSFVFFRETHGAPPMGSIGVPVTAERSIATDKSLMPPGALALIQTELPYFEGNTLQFRPVNRYLLDHDTGSAIKGAGRVDVFMGSGTQAKDRAGEIKSSGSLYYLMLR